MQLSYNQVVSSNGIAGLLGASPGASTAVQVALDVTRCKEMWKGNLWGGLVVGYEGGRSKVAEKWMVMFSRVRGIITPSSHSSMVQWQIGVSPKEVALLPFKYISHFPLNHDCLGGGFKYCLFSPLFGEDSQFWLIFFKWVETTN